MIRLVLSILLITSIAAKAAIITKDQDIRTPAADTVEYNVARNKQMIYLFQTPAETLETATLTINLVGIKSKATKTRIVEVQDENNYLSNDSSEISDIVNGASTHTVEVVGLRENAALATYKIQLLNENNKIIGSKSLRFNVDSRTFIANIGDIGCLTVITCGKYKFPNEKPFYHLYTDSCGLGAGTNVSDTICDKSLR